MKLHQFNSVAERRAALSLEKNVSLDSIGSSTLDETVASAKHCENMIGFAQIPLGVAGPLEIHHPTKTERYYIPLATTEGALVASINRGCKAITESGGVSVYSERKGASRGPSFVVKSLKENIELGIFIKDHKKEFNTLAKQTSSHITLIDVISTMLGNRRFVRFSFDTEDAMGMNMVTIATEHIAHFIENETGAVLEELSSNFCTDKKPGWQNVILGRGFSVWAETFIPFSIVESVLKTTPQMFLDMVEAKTHGSMLSGSIGNNAQAANVIAALYVATGQDIGHISEGSQVFVTTKIDTVNKSLVVSAYLPDCMVGTVGGGTSLPTQRESLELLGISGGNEGHHSKQLAEIVGASVLAGEISLFASLAEGSLVSAHKKFARGNT